MIISVELSFDEVLEVYESGSNFDYRSLPKSPDERRVFTIK